MFHEPREDRDYMEPPTSDDNQFYTEFRKARRHPGATTDTKTDPYDFGDGYFPKPSRTLRVLGLCAAMMTIVAIAGLLLGPALH